MMDLANTDLLSMEDVEQVEESVFEELNIQDDAVIED